MSSDQIRLALRPLRVATTLLMECEAGTLGADTASAADANASDGNVAQFTPTATGWATRVTVTFAATPTAMAALLGDYRLFVACLDNGATVNENQMQFRVVVGGVAGAWSDAVACVALATRSLVELGEFALPPGTWPIEAESASTSVYAATDYVQIEVAAQNTVGNGGGTLDLDALYALPAEVEGVVACADWASGQFVVLDWTGELPAGILAYDSWSLEFGGWADWVGHDLTLVPYAGEAGTLCGYGYDDTAEAASPYGTLALMLYYEPRWW